jgi:Ca-activated chloride channel family protein
MPAPCAGRAARQPLALIAGLVLLARLPTAGQQQPRSGSDGFRFRSGVELVNVTVTVTDDSGRFVTGLERDDFVLYDDGQPQAISHFDRERVPVSLGIAIDTSGSMAGEKLRSARSALERFVFDLLDSQDEIFLYRFSEYPELVQEWTTDRRRLGRALGYLSARGGTALYDTVADALPLAHRGQHQRRALVVISDGSDTSSTTDPRELGRIARENEVMVYAVGVEGNEPEPRQRGPVRLPFPLPFPGRRGPIVGFPPTNTGGLYSGRGDGSNIRALRELTDETGGRTEVVRQAGDIDPATASIAAELSQQYYLGYASPHLGDGRWHTIRVEARNGGYRVRARRGYFATS